MVGLSRLRLCLLGEFTAEADGRPVPLRLPKKAVALLAFLATRKGQACSRNRLTNLLWCERGPEQARHSLRQTLLTIRQTPGFVSAGLLRADGETLSFDAARVDVDTADFERLLAQRSSPSLVLAVSMYRGEFLEGFSLDEVAFQDWVAGERERLRELAVEGLARLLQEQCGSESVESAIQTALRLLQLDRTQEAVHRTLIRLYLRQGRRADALRHYHSCVAVLRRELDTAPEAATVQLFDELRAGRRPNPPTRTPEEARRLADR
jgi:DNA-binding SARP family transcriptional activator